jgi:serine phosphatase RsbU (regulator of sigma subunit)
VNITDHDIARLASFPEQNPNPVIEISIGGRITYQNPAARIMFPDLTDRQISHPLFSAIRNTIVKGKTKELNGLKCELIIDSKVFEQKLYYIEGSDVIRVYSHDITERKENEKKLANLALFPEHNPNPVIEVNLNDCNITYANYAAKNYFPDLFDKGKAHPVFRKINQTVIKVDFETEVTIDDKVFEQKVFYIPGTSLARVYSHNITERKNNEKTLARLATFPEQNPSVIVEIGFNSEITYINTAAKLIFPDLEVLKLQHPLLVDVRNNLVDLLSGRNSGYTREVNLNGKYYMQQVIRLHEIEVIRIFNVDITKQKEIEELIREKNNDILASINYARRIQNAILPSENFISQNLTDHFILYKPKDIVAGDFYWMEIVDEVVFIAAADCTGHGVPGAMVSVVCSNALNRAVKEFALRDPGLILDKTRELVIETFGNSSDEIQDGMDISLLVIDRINSVVKWSGGNNPLLYCAGNEIHEVLPDKQPVGNFINSQPFKTNLIPLEGECIFYLFTDGYADQFGGEKGKKFTYRRFKEQLTQISGKPLCEQRIILQNVFSEWKQNIDQLDDVTVIGISFNAN